MLVAIIGLGAISIFSIPVGLSLSLVRDYTRTYNALDKNLREVEQLSARTLAQEQEKQHLLARQNELLEEQVHERTAELHQSLEELKATQAQCASCSLRFINRIRIREVFIPGAGFHILERILLIGSRIIRHDCQHRIPLG